MKEKYEKPTMVTEKIEMFAIAGSPGIGTGPVQEQLPLGGCCCN